jgi:enamine deaminase RidA (YjgF/YER057c/UK114 family)
MDETGTVPKDLKDEIHNIFASISRVIKHALSEQKLENGWEKVFRVTTYHVNLKETEKEVLDYMVKEMREWCPGHAPIWTLVGCERLALEQMRVEIEVTAHAG